MAKAAKARDKKKSSKHQGRKDQVKIGIIGGSGLYHMKGLTDTREVRVKTPFGDPSDAIVIGTLEGQRVAFLARHGRGHLIAPSEINYRANICAMKCSASERIISVSAVGSLREDLPPLDFLIPDQFFDRTLGRISTFFGGGIVAHVGFDKPTCAELSAHLADACDRIGVKAHRGGTYVCMEGPQFSTLAESHTYRQLRFDVIGMTNAHRGQARPRSGNLLRQLRDDHRLRLLAPAAQLRHSRRDHLQPQSQHRKRAARHPRGGARLRKRRPKLQVRRGPGARYPDRSQGHFPGCEETSGADYRQIHFLNIFGSSGVTGHLLDLGGLERYVTSGCRFDGV